MNDKREPDPLDVLRAMLAIKSEDAAEVRDEADTKAAPALRQERPDARKRPKNKTDLD